MENNLKIELDDSTWKGWWIDIIKDPAVTVRPFQYFENEKGQFKVTECQSPLSVTITIKRENHTH